MIVRKAATLQEVKGKYAILALDGGQTLQLLRDELEPTAEPGTSFVLQILPESEAAMERDELARTLLNQILDDEQEKPKN